MDLVPDADRRKSDRFKVEREVVFRAVGKRGGEEAGEGRTVNMSSSGVLFTSQTILRPGRRVELTISWPVLLNDKCRLKLVARGRIVRYESGCAAMEITAYEFRTQPTVESTPAIPKLVATSK